MSILSSTNTGKVIIRCKIEDWLKENGIKNTTIGNNLTISVKDADVNLVGYRDEELPKYINFKEITGGSFFCSWSKLKTMRGFPKMVEKIFDISHSKIESLEHAPKIVDINYAAHGLNFTKEEIQAKTRVTCNIYC
jgi:hypothetical protein